ncbi:MAG: ATP-dependent DNA helicase RecG [Mogibacterium sp.]|nr:ATP-dependent DNA helicase RecG [Mogibacterium sp.]
MADLLSLASNVDKLPGVGPKKLERMKALGIYSVLDLLYYFPIKYRDRRETVLCRSAAEDRDVLVEACLVKISERRFAARKSLTECIFKDDSCTFSVAFFNMPYVKNNLEIGETYSIFGKMKRRNGMACFVNPEYAVSGSEYDKRKIVPVYRCTQGITNRELVKLVEYVLNNVDFDCEWLSYDLRKDNRVCDIGFALKNIHFPENERDYKVAKYRLSYDELLTYQIALRLNRRLIDDDEVDASVEDVDIGCFLEKLPYELTDGQKAAISDIEKDLILQKPMNRLVQGDVGCGKTVVAETAIYKCVKAGLQAAYMAPTEIMERKHFSKIADDMSEFGFKTALLVSGMKASERRSVLSGLATGEIDIVVGTHALFTEDVEYANLGLVITDEQHRFGVNQRKSLVQKGKAVNVMVMSATPIPRTLAATVFSDMDFSIIKGKPSNRLPIITKAVDSASRMRAYASVIKELECGRQAYVVAPSIDSDDDDLTSVEKLFEELKEIFKGYRTALIHGRMTGGEKDRIMNDFAEGKIQVLVATIVIEVGIDVPNATAIVIENAERFGLAQLHQLRGRVGRSEFQSYCYLVNYSRNEKSAERIDAMVRLSDGFEISEIDFMQRGPGDIMGTMQSGHFNNRILSLCSNESLLKDTIRDAERILSDKSLVNDYTELLRRVNQLSAVDNSDII